MSVCASLYLMANNVIIICFTIIFVVVFHVRSLQIPLGVQCSDLSMHYNGPKQYVFAEDAMHLY